MSGPLPAWVRLDMRYWNDEDLEAAATDSGYRLTTYALWPLMICSAKEASSLDNRDGTFRSTPRRLARYIGTTSEEVSAVLASLAEAELLRVEDAKVGRLDITIASFKRWQTVKGSDAERKARERADAEMREQGKSVSLSGSCPGDVTDESLETGDGRRETEEGAKAPLSDSARPNADLSESLAISRVLDYANERTGRRLTRTEARRSKVRARIREGFTEQQLRAAVDHYSASPFHQGDNDRGVRYDSPEVMFRDAGQIEKAFEQPAAVSSVAHLPRLT